MSAFGTTILGLLDPTADDREARQIPIMTRVEQMRFVKMALQDIPGAQRQFNQVFGGKKRASDYDPVKLIDAGVPAFLWTQ